MSTTRAGSSTTWIWRSSCSPTWATTRARLSPRPDPRRWLDDVGCLAPTAHRNAGRAARARARGGAAGTHRHLDGRRLPPRRHRLVPLPEPGLCMREQDRRVPSAVPDAQLHHQLVHALAGSSGRAPSRPVHPRPRARHLPPGLDAKHHPAPLALRQAGPRRRRRHRHQRAFIVADRLVASASILSQTVTVNGRVVESNSSSGGVLGAHSQLAAPGSGQHAVFHVTYQPASFFWTLQIRETLLFTAVGAALLLFAAWWTHRR